MITLLNDDKIENENLNKLYIYLLLSSIKKRLDFNLENDEIIKPYENGVRNFYGVLIGEEGEPICDFNEPENGWFNRSLNFIEEFEKRGNSNIDENELEKWVMNEIIKLCG